MITCANSLDQLCKYLVVQHFALSPSLTFELSFFFDCGIFHTVFYSFVFDSKEFSFHFSHFLSLRNKKKAENELKIKVRRKVLQRIFATVFLVFLCSSTDHCSDDFIARHSR